MEEVDLTELVRIVDERGRNPVGINIADSLRDDLRLVDRLAAVRCVLKSPDVPLEQRATLLRRYVEDSNNRVQGEALATDRAWDADSIPFLRSLECGPDNEFYRLRTLACLGDVQVLEQCRSIIKSGKGYSGAHPVSEAAILAAELGTAEAVAFLRSLFAAVSSGYSDYVAVVVALSLYRCKVNDGVDFLEAKLDSCNEEMGSPDIGILAAAALAAAGSAKGMRRVEHILAEKDDRELMILRQFLYVLEIPAAQEWNWIDRVREWLKNQDRPNA